MPVHASMLPDEVQEIIGQVGPNTVGAQRLLESIGFQYSGRVDPFDGGPHYEADTDQVTFVRDTRSYQPIVGEPDDTAQPAVTCRPLAALSRRLDPRAGRARPRRQRPADPRARRRGRAHKARCHRRRGSCAGRPASTTPPQRPHQPRLPARPRPDRLAADQRPGPNRPVSRARGPAACSGRAGSKPRARLCSPPRRRASQETHRPSVRCP